MQLTTHCTPPPQARKIYKKLKAQKAEADRRRKEIEHAEANERYAHVVQSLVARPSDSCVWEPRSRLEAEENLRLAAEKQEWDMMGEESQRREDAAKEKETAAKKKEQARLQMEQLEEVGYGDNFTSLEGTGPPPLQRS